MNESVDQSPKSKKNKVVYFAVAVVVLPVLSFLLSGSKTNPEVKNTVKWDSETTKDYFYKACADCHSHETKWPWYTNFAPVSWMIIHHVNEGREHFNISTVDMGEPEEAAEEFEEGEMPLQEYLWTHAQAKLNKEQKKEFLAGLKKTFGEEKKHKKHEHDDD